MSTPTPHALSAQGGDRTDGEGEWRAARATSIALGLLGLVVFWGSMAAMFFVLWRYLSASTPEPRAGGSFATYTTVSSVASVVALTAHVFGLVIIRKAPREKRKGGVVLNGLALILLLGMKAFGLLWQLSH